MWTPAKFSKGDLVAYMPIGSTEEWLGIITALVDISGAVEQWYLVRFNIGKPTFPEAESSLRLIRPSMEFYPDWD